MLEKMNEFFDNRLDIYDEHQLTCIDNADEFFTYTASLLPKCNCNLLDLGCGTGLELEYYFKLNNNVKITGIDLAEGMLNRLKNKFPEKNMNLIQGSYFDVPFGENAFDVALSVESLHHFTFDEKLPLYTKLCNSLKNNGYFVLTDYFSLTDEEENFHRARLIRLKEEQGINDNELYHYDTPLTVAHEVACLEKAGFKKVEVMKNWGQTYTIKATR